MKILSVATFLLACSFSVATAGRIHPEGPFPLTPCDLSSDNKGIESFTPSEWCKILLCDTFEQSLFLFKFDDDVFAAILSNFDYISPRGKEFLAKNLSLSPPKILALAKKYDNRLLSCLEYILWNKDVPRTFFEISQEDRVHILKYLSCHSIELSEETCWKLWTHSGFDADYYEAVSSLPNFPWKRALKENGIKCLSICSETVAEKIQERDILFRFFSITGSPASLENLLKTQILSESEKEELMALLSQKNHSTGFEALLEVLVENLDFNDKDGLRILDWITEQNSTQNLLSLFFKSGKNGDFLRLQILRKIEPCALNLIFPVKQNFSLEMQKEMLKFDSGRYLLALTTSDSTLAENLLKSGSKIEYALLQNDDLLLRNPHLRSRVESRIDDEILLQIVEQFMNRKLRKSDFKFVNQRIPEIFFQRYLSIEESKISIYFPMFFINLSHNQQNALLSKRPDSLFYFPYQKSLSPIIFSKIKKELLQFADLKKSAEI